MTNEHNKSTYYIFVNGGDKIYLLGSDGNYLQEYNADEAMQFGEKIDAVIYIEKHGLEKIATVRKVKC